MGTKKVKEKDILKFQIITRLNETRYLYLEKLLHQSRCHSMSELMRDILNNKKITVVTYDETLDLYMEQLITVQSEINLVGKNINQVVQFFNGAPDEKKETYQALKIADQYQEIGLKVDRLYKLVDVLAKKWLAIQFD